MDIKTVENFNKVVQKGDILVYRSNLTIYTLEFLEHSTTKPGWFRADHLPGTLLRGETAHYPKIWLPHDMGQPQYPWYWELRTPYTWYQDSCPCLSSPSEDCSIHTYQWHGWEKGSAAYSQAIADMAEE